MCVTTLSGRQAILTRSITPSRARRDRFSIGLPPGAPRVDVQSAPGAQRTRASVKEPRASILAPRRLEAME